MPTGKNRVGEASCEYTAVASMGLLLPTGKFIAVPLFAKGTHIFSGQMTKSKSLPFIILKQFVLLPQTLLLQCRI